MIYSLINFFIGFKTILYTWQTLVGAIIGFSAPFILWWYVERYQQRKRRRENIFYLEKIINDQINMILGAKGTMNIFINERLERLKENIRRNPEEVWSVDRCNFPLFSIRAITGNVLNINFESNYISNKVNQSYAFSKDLPCMFDDIKNQFIGIIQLNQEISLRKLNSPIAQKRNYLENIDAFQTSLRQDMLEKNFPIYLKVLTQTKVALNGFAGMGFLKWRIRFDPEFRFFLTREAFKKAKTSAYDEVENFFESKVTTELENY